MNLLGTCSGVAATLLLSAVALILVVVRHPAAAVTAGPPEIASLRAATSDLANSYVVKQAGLLYPDLRAEPPTDLVLDVAPIGGLLHHLLRFSTITWNAGPGPLELGGTPSGVTAEVHQRVYDEAGSVTEFPVGTFSFSDDHHHWHFENFARYELWTRAAFDQWLAGGRTGQPPEWLSYKTTGLGVGFCMRDSLPMAIQGVPIPHYSSCGSSVQGISVGWGDIYEWDLPGQWIDTGENPLPDGDYVLRIVADPLNLIYESEGRADPARESEEANEAVLRFAISSGVIKIAVE